MNDKLFRTILKRYEAEIEDAHYKINAICEHNLVIPEHIDITGEVDKQLERIAAAEDKLAAMRKYYGGKKAEKQVLQPLYMYGKKNKKKIKTTLKIMSFCHFKLLVLVYNNNMCQNVVKKSVR